MVELASTGCYCEYDLFGMEASHYQLDSAVDMPSDAQRIERIKWLVDEGYQDQITIAHDVHTKHRLVSILDDILLWVYKAICTCLNVLGVCVVGKLL